MRTVSVVGLSKPVSKIGLGTWQFGSREWGYGDAYAGGEAVAIVRRAVELGVTLFDTAEAYAFGRSERILGAALGERRQDVVLATKIFPVAPLAPVVRQRGRASARRLGVDRIDLYQLHWPNPLVPLEQSMRGMRALRDEGVIDEVGVSNYDLARWQAAERALGARVLSDQVEYSLLTRGPQDALIPWAEAQGRLVIAYSPLAQGVLSGRYTVANAPGGFRGATNAAFQPENLRRLQPLLDTLREVAAGHAGSGATLAQVALAWAVRSPAVVAIPGASSVRQVESNAAAADLQLRAEEVAALSAAAQAYRPVPLPPRVPARAAAGALAGQARRLVARLGATRSARRDT